MAFGSLTLSCTIPRCLPLHLPLFCFVELLTLCLSIVVPSAEYIAECKGHRLGCIKRSTNLLLPISLIASPNLLNPNYSANCQTIPTHHLPKIEPPHPVISECLHEWTQSDPRGSCNTYLQNPDTRGRLQVTENLWLHNFTKWHV